MEERYCKEGVRVIADINSEHHKQYAYQYTKNEQLVQGTITREPHEGGEDLMWTQVKWDNGHINTYPCYMLKNIDDIEGGETMPTTQIENGMKVRANKHHRDYGQLKVQHGDGDTMIGTVVNILDDVAIVQWGDNEERYVYPLDYLIPKDIISPIATIKAFAGLSTSAITYDDPWTIVERIPSDPKAHEKKITTKPIKASKQNAEKVANIPEPVIVEEKYTMPLLVGERVCIDPSGFRSKEDYEYFTKLSENTAGYIISNECVETDLIRWRGKSESARESWSHKVKFDNGKIEYLHTREMLPIDAPPKTIRKYYMKSGEIVIQTEGETSTKLDELIIARGKTIDSITVFDDAWRERIKKEIERYNSQK